MAFHVEITEPALADAEDYLHFLVETQKEPQAASRWLEGLLEAIGTLERFPERCPLIPEADEFETEVRHLVYYSHRIIFGVKQAAKAVTVYRIYHGARRKLRPDIVD